MTIEECKKVTDELVSAWGKLMPQLSSSASAPTKDWLEQVVDSSILYIAKSGDQIVGSLTLTYCIIPVGRKAWIEDVVVDESMRGQRIGELLTNVAVERARADGAKNINLTSNSSRLSAHRLYERAGFKIRDTSVYRYAQ